MKYDYYKVLERMVLDWVNDNPMATIRILEDGQDIHGKVEDLLKLVEEPCRDWFEGNEEQAKDAVLDNLGLIELFGSDPKGSLKRMSLGKWCEVDSMIRNDILPIVVYGSIARMECNHVSEFAVQED